MTIVNELAIQMTPNKRCESALHSSSSVHLHATWVCTNRCNRSNYSSCQRMQKDWIPISPHHRDPTQIHRDLCGKYYLLDFFHHCKAVRKQKTRCVMFQYLLKTACLLESALCRGHYRWIFWISHVQDDRLVSLMSCHGELYLKMKGWKSELGTTRFRFEPCNGWWWTIPECCPDNECSLDHIKSGVLFLNESQMGE